MTTDLMTKAETKIETGQTFDVIPLYEALGHEHVMQSTGVDTFFDYFITDGVKAGSWSGFWEKGEGFKVEESSKTYIVFGFDKLWDAELEYRRSFAYALPFENGKVNLDGPLVRFSVAHASKRRDFRGNPVYTALGIDAGAIEGMTLPDVMAHQETLAKNGKAAADKIIDQIAKVALEMGLPANGERELGKRIVELRQAQAAGPQPA